MTFPRARRHAHATKAHALPRTLSWARDLTPRARGDHVRALAARPGASTVPHHQEIGDNNTALLLYYKKRNTSRHRSARNEHVLEVLTHHESSPYSCSSSPSRAEVSSSTLKIRKGVSLLPTTATLHVLSVRGSVEASLRARSASLTN